MTAQTPAIPYHHGDLKTAILERSAQIISQQGIEALSLRAVARDLGVSHGAPNRHFKNKAQLLAALAANIWQTMLEDILQNVASGNHQDPQAYLNALGRCYLQWALDNKAAFLAINHPDLSRYNDDAVKASKEAFHDTVVEAVKGAQDAGRYPEVDLELLSLYTVAVPFGAAMLISNAQILLDIPASEQDSFIAKVIELVVPVAAQLK